MDEVSEEIIKGCVHNDHRCKKIIYEQYYKKMYAICLRYSGDRDEAKDILQDGFIKMFDKIKQVDSAEKFEGWIKRLFTNHCIDYLKSAYKKYIKYESDFNEYISDEALYESDTIVFNNAGQFEISDLMDALNKLKPDYRIIINMYAIEKFNHLEIADNGLVLAAWRHRSRKAFKQNKNSWNDTLSQTTSSHVPKPCYS